MSHGGARRGAGRKPLPMKQTIRMTINQTIPTAKWERLINELYEQACKGNMRAAELLFSYRFGDAKSQPPLPRRFHQHEWRDELASLDLPPTLPPNLPDPFDDEQDLVRH